MISLQGITDLKPFPSRSLIFLPGGAVAPPCPLGRNLWILNLMTKPNKPYDTKPRLDTCI